jgi:hypothetical protein
MKHEDFIAKQFIYVETERKECIYLHRNHMFNCSSKFNGRETCLVTFTRKGYIFSLIYYSFTSSTRAKVTRIQYLPWCALLTFSGHISSLSGTHEDDGDAAILRSTRPGAH